jgi:phosphoglycolate phosphatase
MYCQDKLLILDADGTTIDAFSAMETAFQANKLNLGDLERFQKRRHLFKYIGGLKEFPANLANQVSKSKRERLIDTLTEVYRHEAKLYEGMADWINQLTSLEGLRVGMITRNVTRDATETIKLLLERHGADVSQFDFLLHLPLKKSKTAAFRLVREKYSINPALSYACGDEKKDFLACIETGIHPFMVSYGFEDYERLTQKIGVPSEIISESPSALRQRVNHTLGIA